MLLTRNSFSIIINTIMDFIYILKLTPHYEKPENWDENADQIMDRHWNYLVDLHAKGVMQLVGRTSYSPGHKDLFGIAVFAVDSEDRATEIMNGDPSVSQGMMTPTVHPFNLSLLAGRPYPS